MSKHGMRPNLCGGLTEIMTPVSAWLKLKPGDVVIMRKSGTRRIVLEARNRYITLKKLTCGKFRNIETTVYGYSDRSSFILPDHCYDQISLEDFCPYI